MTQDSAVGDLIRQAREAQRIYETFDQAQVDDVVAAIAWVVLEPDRNRYLSKRAVEDTGLGDVEDKFTKNYRKTLGLLRDLSGARSVGVISEDKSKGIIEIARPVGVVGAITPSTNPVATPTNKVMNALKGRNAIILAPSPRGEAVCEELVVFFQDALEHDDALWKLAIPIALQNSLPNFVDLMTSKGNIQRRFLIQTLKKFVLEADDQRLRMLIDGNGISLVARWLVGRNDVKSDRLRTELLFDDRLDSIDKSRLLERLLHRQNEPSIQQLAADLIENSTDNLVLSAAQNLYTSSTNNDS